MSVESDNGDFLQSEDQSDTATNLVMGAVLSHHLVLGLFDQVVVGQHRSNGKLGISLHHV